MPPFSGEEVLREAPFLYAAKRHVDPTEQDTSSDDVASADTIGRAANGFIRLLS